MSEFLHEGGTSDKSRLPLRPKEAKKKAAKDARKAPLPPATRRRVAAERKPGRLDPDVGAIMQDFKAGVSRLSGLTARLAEQRPHKPEFAKDRPARPAPTPSALIQRHLPPPLSKIIERELKLVSEQVPHVIRVRERGQITREYESRVKSVVQQHLPQIYAAILRAEREVKETRMVAKPATTVLRPSQPAVKSLIKAAQAIRSGRLPFLEKKTREEAKTLLERIWGTKRTTRVINSNNTETRRLIEQHRLLPLAVRESIVHDAYDRAHKAGWARPPHSSRAGPPREFVRDVEREIIKLLPAPRWDEPKGSTTAPLPIGAHDIPRLQQQGVPAFATQGAAAGGSYVVDPGENVHVITRDNPITGGNAEPAEPARGAPGGRAATERPPRVVTRDATARPPREAAGGPATVQAPAPARHVPPAVPAVRTGRAAGVAGAAPGGGGAETQGPMEISGTLEIAGLKQLVGWVGEIKGSMRKRNG